MTTAHDIEILADSLSACADELHARIMKAIRQTPPAPRAAEDDGGATPASLDQGITHGAAQALFENEVALRQRANSLYVDAAQLAASGLGASRQELLDLVALARRKVRYAHLVKDVTAVAAGMLALAAAIAAGKPDQLPAAAGAIREHLAQLRDDRAG